MGVMTDRKYITWEECVARGWFSRSMWKSKGILIRDDAAPKDYAWKPVVRTSYPVFSEDRGTPIVKRAKAVAVPDLSMGDLFRGGRL